MARSTWMLAAILACGAPWVSPAGAEDFSTNNVFELPRGAVSNGGALLIAGGGEQPDSVYEEFIRLAGGSEARIVLIPSAYPYEDREHIEWEFSEWRDYEVASLEFCHTDDPEEADSDDWCEPLRKATGVWIAGGAQERLTDRYLDRQVQQLLRDVVTNGGVVGGYSAGASVLSETMILYGTPTEAVISRGLGLTNRLIIDQHFSERGRFPRLLGVLEERLGHIGLGVDEGTAAIVEGNRMRVIGNGRATVFIGPTHPGEATAVYRLRDGDEAEGILVHHVGKGVSFDLRKRQ